MYAQERIAQDILKLLYNFLSKYSASLIFQQISRYMLLKLQLL